MRKFFTLLTLCLLASAAWAVDITFVAGVDNGNSPGTAQAFQIEKDGIKIEVSNGLANDSQYRIYKGQTATITSSIGAITQVVFECTASGDAQYGPGCFTWDVGDYTYQDKIGTWTGESSKIVFTASTNQVRATKIIVTVGQAGLATPTITPAGGTYYSPVEVSMSCATSGATIYYTTNGSNPTTSSTRYTAPFTVSTATTVKAISAKDGEVSDVVSESYEFATATPVNSIAEYQGLPDGTVVMFKNPVTAIYQHNSTLFVKDNTGYALFYGKPGKTYNKGDVIPAGFVGTKVTYNGEPELQIINGFNDASGNNPVEPEEITANQVAHNKFAHFVKMDEVTIVKVDDRSYQITDKNGNTCTAYVTTLGVNPPASLDGLFDVEGIVGSYGSENTIYQLLPTLIKKHKNPGERFGWGKMHDVEDGAEVSFDYDAIVLGQAGQYLYMMDETGCGLAYGSCGKTYKYGDIVPAGFSGSKTTWDGEPELQNLAGFESPIGNIGGIEALNKDARPTNPSEVGPAIWGQYIKLSQVKINTSEKTFTDANGNHCPYYDRFGIAFPADTEQSYDVYGIVASYGKTNTVYQVLPTFIDVKIDTVDVADIPELYALGQGVPGHFTTRLTAIYQNGSNLYVKDVNGNYSLAYGPVDGTFVNGDYINDAIATWTVYQNNPQLVPGADTFVKAGHGDPVQPEVMPLEEVSQDMVHWYLLIENARIYKDGDNTMIDDGTESIILYNRFNVEVPEDDEEHDVWGFLTVYRGLLEFYPISVDKDPGEPVTPPFLKGDVNGDGEVNIADVNALVDIIMGGQADADTLIRADVNEDSEINIADVNALIDIILGGN